MKCPTCNGTLQSYDDGELVCQGECGSAFGLEYLGYYKEGSNDRIEDGFEEKEWKEKWKKPEEFNDG